MLIRNLTNSANTINSGDWLQIKKVQCQLFKSLQTNSLYTIVRGFHFWNPCHVASHPGSQLYTPSFLSEWLGSGVWTALPLCERENGKKPTWNKSVCSTSRNKIKCGQYSNKGISTKGSNFCVLLFLQEEEIPELEIDIDELLELTDEGQRSRLQVRLSNSRTFTFSSHYSPCLSCYLYIQ